MHARISFWPQLVDALVYLMHLHLHCYGQWQPAPVAVTRFTLQPRWSRQRREGCKIFSLHCCFKHPWKAQPGTLSQEGAYLYLFGLGEKLRNLSASDNLLDPLCSILNVTGSKHSTKSQLTVNKSILFLQPKISTGLHLSRWQASYRPAGVSLISRSGAVTVFPDKR